MGWGRFDDEYDDNPKCRAAGKDGRALDQVGIRYCAKHHTDGVIPDHDLPLLAAKAEVGLKRTLRRLIEVGRWHGPGHDCDRCPPCPPGAAVVHDYLDYNPSGEAERDKKRQRAEAGRKGGLKSRPPGSKPEANASANASANGQAEAEAEEKQIGTPYPVPPVESKGGENSRAAANQAAPPDQPPDRKCPAHRHIDGHGPPCGQCADARRTADAWQQERPTSPLDGMADWQRRRAETGMKTVRALAAEEPDPDRVTRLADVRAALHQPHPGDPT